VNLAVIYTSYTA